jgi:hypothetical protein
MAATALTVQSAPHSGLTVTYSTPTQTTGHTAPTGSDVALLIKNGGAGTLNVDLHAPGAIDGILLATPAGAAAPSRRVVVGITSDGIIPVPTEVYGDPVTGLITFDIGQTTSVTFACVRF